MIYAYFIKKNKNKNKYEKYLIYMILFSFFCLLIISLVSAYSRSGFRKKIHQKDNITRQRINKLRKSKSSSGASTIWPA